MKLNLNPIASLRADAARKINERFAATTDAREAVWSAKRMIAASGAYTPEFEEEATLRGIAPSELAALVLAKPDIAAKRELERQRALLSIEVAPTPPEIDSIVEASFILKD